MYTVACLFGYILLLQCSVTLRWCFFLCLACSLHFHTKHGQRWDDLVLRLRAEGQAVVARNLRQVVLCVVLCQTRDSAGLRGPRRAQPAPQHSALLSCFRGIQRRSSWLTWTRFAGEPLGASRLMRHNKNSLLSLYIYPEVLHVRAPPAPSAASSAAPLHFSASIMTQCRTQASFCGDKQLLSPGRIGRGGGHRRRLDQNWNKKWLSFWMRLSPTTAHFLFTPVTQPRVRGFRLQWYKALTGHKNVFNNIYKTPIIKT